MNAYITARQIAALAICFFATQGCGGGDGTSLAPTPLPQADAPAQSALDQTMGVELLAAANSRRATAMVPPQTVEPSPAGTVLGNSAIINGNFEADGPWWVQSASNGHTLIGTWAGYNAHSGKRFALLGGYNNATDVLYQDVRLPSGVPQVKLQFAFQVLGSKPASAGAVDVLAVDLVNPTSGKLIANLATYSNLDSTSAWQATPMFDMTPYSDQLVRLRFTATTSGANPTFFLLDDVDVGSLNPRDNLPQTGWWWNPAEGGRGFAIERQGSKIFLSGFLYESSGSPVWYVSTLDFQTDGSYVGPLLRYANGQTLLGAYKAPGNPVTVATAILVFDATSSGTLTAKFADGTPSRSIRLERFPISTPVAFATPQNQFQSGWWWNASEGGRGYFIDVQGAQAFVGSFMYDASGQPVWYVSSATLSGTMNLAGTLAQYNGGQTLTSSYRQATQQPGSAGTVSFNFSSPTAGTMTLPNQTKVALTRFVFGEQATYANAQVAADCSGTNCGAVDNATYSGSGIGVWRFDNNGTQPVTIDLNFKGVTGGNKVTVLMSNGSTKATTFSPSMGTEPGGASNGAPKLRQAAPAAGVETQIHSSHFGMLERNRSFVQQLVRGDLTSHLPPHLTAQRRVASATPEVNSTRVWTDTFNVIPKQYDTKVYSTCTLPSGRNVVFWVDPAALSNNAVTPAAMASLSGSFCGPNGGMARMNTLLGDVWGPLPSAMAGALIQDAPGKLLDINIVILNMAWNTPWAGYFYSLNNALNSPPGVTNSNEALVFFINSNTVKNYLESAISTLLHEATHMTNFYQRGILRQSEHDTWLEETSAMMTEDIIVPTVDGGFDNTAIWTSGYVHSGGMVSYINWPMLSTDNYHMGAAFGAYLSRHYGLAIYRELATDCQFDTKVGYISSYDCLDSIIKKNGGVGMADDFGNFGATIFGTMPNAKAPARYGYPQKTDGGYSLPDIDVGRFSAYLGTPQPVGTVIDGTEHALVIDVVPAGVTSYVRKGIVLPPNVSLRVIIQ